MKIRSGHLGLEHRAAALSAFSRITEESLHVLGVSDRHYRVAARFADRAPLGVRAGDALHLAIAFEAGLSIATLDRKLAEAGSALGVPTELLRLCALRLERMVPSPNVRQVNSAAAFSLPLEDLVHADQQIAAVLRDRKAVSIAGLIPHQSTGLVGCAGIEVDANLLHRQMERL